MKLPSSLKSGIMLLAKHPKESNLGERAAVFVLENNKVKKICVVHIINFKNGNVTLERNIEYNYAAMKCVMAECHTVV
jgi:hypothetical protein